MNFAATRGDALERLREFVEISGRYGRDRNQVQPSHGNVSRLSAAIRHRLVTEWEVAAAPLEKYAPSTVEKFTQEVYWRNYWKGWLSLRPQVWDDYRAGIEEHPGAEAIRNGEGPVAVMNDFARELVETGYLHNHARMWFAGYWVHVARLPWQLGAKFFEDHLLDFDPASNTLSWRWVAGWQTPGKTYLPRRGNLEKYLHPDLLRPGGLEHIENPSAQIPKGVTRPPVTRERLPDPEMPEKGRVLWIHEEDLHPESSLLANYEPSKIILTGRRHDRSELQRAWLDQALEDTAARASEHYGVEVERAESLAFWLQEHERQKVVGLRPEVGPLHDELKDLGADESQITLMVREEDRYLRPMATAGFFKFWKKLQGKLQKGDFPLFPATDSSSS